MKPKGFNELEEKVIKSDLCTHCGMCVGICPVSCLEIKDPLGKAVPVNRGDCSFCGLCVDICSGIDVDFERLNEIVFKTKADYLVGNIRGIWTGYAIDNQIRTNASSGGCISAMLISLLETKSITGAFVLGFNEKKPYEPQVRIAHNKDEVLSARGSKYTLWPIGENFDQVLNENGELAVVMLPCQVHAFRKLQIAQPQLSKKVKYVIGLYCGNVIYFDALHSLFNRFKIRDVNEIKSVNFRAGRWPGRFEVMLKNGYKYSISKFAFNYLTPFYIPKRCLYCIDLTNEFADISVGDGWIHGEKTSDGGWSVIIGRTDKGLDAINIALEEKALYLEPITKKELINMHSHLLDFKKKGAVARIINSRKNGSVSVDYHIKLNNVSNARLKIEEINSCIFSLCSKRVTRFLVNLLPIRFLEFLFTRLRSVWKNLSREKNGPR